MQRKVLVLGDDTRSFLATVRSLARAGLQVHVAPFGFRAPALKSRYISRIHRLPHYLGDGQEWLAAAGALFRRENFDLVLPCDERTLLPLHHYRDELSRWSRLAVPDARSLELFFDKHNTRQFARELDIPVAKGRLLHSTDTPVALAAEMGLPLAIKPCVSYSLDKLFSRNRVIIAADERELALALHNAKDARHFCESFFEGTGAGVSVLANQGRILQAFEHHRVHELQGSSYYRVSAAISPTLMNAVEKIITGAGYTGVAMFEFRINRAKGEWILLEINARPWGSLPLPVALGVDFPYRWYQLLVEQRETPRRDYRTEIYGRNVIPNLRYFLARARALNGKPLKLAKFLLAALGEYSRIFRGREVYDVWARDDPAPAWSELAELVQEISRNFWAKMPGYAALARRRDRRDLQCAVAHGADGLAITFVCQGNICRSPVAAALLQKGLQGTNYSVKVQSAGILPRTGAISPSNAVEAAVAVGVDLKVHRSRYFSDEMADEADIVVIFDELNRQRIADRYPALRAPVVMLGSFRSASRFDRAVRDPDGGDLATFQEIYAEITDAVAGLASHIVAGAGHV